MINYRYLQDVAKNQYHNPLLIQQTKSNIILFKIVGDSRAQVVAHAVKSESKYLKRRQHMYVS